MTQLRGNPYGHVTFHKNWHVEKIKYPVLVASQVDAQTREMIRATVKPLVSSEDIERLVHHDKGWERGWSMVKLDAAGLGRCVLLLYKGIEAVLFFKRQVNEIAPGPGEPLPENPIKDPADLWQRFDLLGKSAKQENKFLAGRHDQLLVDNKRLQTMVDVKQNLIDQFETTVLGLNTRIEELEGQVARSADRYNTITSHLPGKKVAKWLEEARNKKKASAKKRAKAEAFSKSVKKAVAAKQNKRVAAKLAAEIKAKKKARRGTAKKKVTKKK